MHRRILYLLPDLSSARRMMDDLLLARVEERHIHFIAKEGTPMDGLHEANVLQKSDLVHGAQQGLVIGVVLGAVAGGLADLTLASDASAGWQIIIVLGATIAGAILGAWASSMAGAAIPNSRLRPFEKAIEDGKVVLMVDVPEHRVEEIRERLHSIHPEAEDRGLDPHVPAFP